LQDFLFLGKGLYLVTSLSIVIFDSKSVPELPDTIPSNDLTKNYLKNATPRSNPPPYPPTLSMGVDNWKWHMGLVAGNVDWNEEIFPTRPNPG